MERKERIQQELEQIRDEHDGLLRAEDVVEFARNPQTALHSCFTWDDDEAARQFRLWQARRVIKVHVTVLPSVADPIRIWVSLESDRKRPGGGYRHLEDVMADEDYRRQLLDQALRDARRWQRKYELLNELAPVFASLEMVEETRRVTIAAD